MSARYSEAAMMNVKSIVCVFLATGLLCAGCSANGHLGIVDGSADRPDLDVDGGLVDTGFVDAGPDVGCPNDDLAIIGHESVAIDSLRFLQAPSIHEGQSIRFAAGVQPAECRQFGGVALRTFDATRVVTLEAVVHKNGPGHCDPAPAFGEEALVAAGLDVGTWTLQDVGSATPIDLGTFEVLPCADDCWCAGQPATLGIGEACEYDCDCDPGLTCVAFAGTTPADELRQCHRTCSSWFDCDPGYVCALSPDGPWGTCDPLYVGPPITECQHREDCPPGYDCWLRSDGGRWCFELVQRYLQGMTCQCDSQCGGLQCLHQWHDETLDICYRICRGNRDCKFDEYCGIATVSPSYKFCLVDWE